MGVKPKSRSYRIRVVLPGWNHRPSDLIRSGVGARSRCGYVGLLGGRRTQSQRRAALIDRGLDESACERIHGPIGLDIGARTPEQIAVSILAQLIALGRAP